MKMKFLCATDGSLASEKAVAWTVDLCKALKGYGLEAELTFLTVSMVPEEGESVHGVSIMKNAVDEQVFRELHTARARALEAGIGNVTCAKASGRNIAATIIHYAESEGYNHIIVGSTGRTGVARILLGSVASEVVAKAHCPVTVVR
ncbi:MAG: universal stress protein [Thermodesulfovibrionales bacterium]